MKFIISGGILHRGDVRGFAHDMGVDMDQLAGGIGDWLIHCAMAKPGKGPLCVACDHEFRPDRLAPQAFFVMIASDRKKQKVVNITLSGICSACLKMGDKELLAYWHKHHADACLGPVGPDRVDLGIVDTNAGSKVH